ncbi:hypothetical protein M3Y96_00805500 [Aphelenchoides besseyi]|nr:hypothetical protein M3Y96_00805500 [Aphelenchoides besseyi]
MSSTRPRRSTRHSGAAEKTATSSRHTDSPADPGPSQTSDAPTTRSSDRTDKSRKTQPLKAAAPPKRKRRHVASDDSDEEFERLLDEREQQIDEEEKKKEKEREDRRLAKKKRENEKKSALQEEHQNHCEECGQVGELILCDGCPKAYHLVCIDPDMNEIPEGLWLCKSCVENGVEVAETNEQTGTPKNLDSCLICKEGGFLLCCDTCPNSFHAYCLNPPLTKLPPPDESWSCFRCLAPQPKNRPDKYISWRWKYCEYPDPLPEEDHLKEGEDLDSVEPERYTRLMLRPMRKMEPRKERELFVKYKYLSYWHCEWVPEYVLEVHYMQSLRMYWRKMDPDNPPEVEDVPSEPTDKDPHCMEYRFYRYGIKPEWLQVHRVVNHHQVEKGVYDYLIKWKELNYEYATWEADDFVIPGINEAIYKYWIHRENMTNVKIPKSVERKLNAWREKHNMKRLDEEKQRRKDEVKKPTVDLCKKYEQQPSYLDETGGKLHAYQLEGLNWLRHNFSQDTDSILADEMGLGKTIQATTFLYSLMKEGHSKGPFLIAAPLSTLINWEREAEFWAPDFYVVTYIGDKESRTVIREHEFSFFEGAVRGGPKAMRMNTEQGIKFHVLLTSYELINMDKAILSSIEWAAIVVDEAHRLKNNQSLFFRTLNEFRINHRLLLTGTPLQNNLEELFHLLNFLSADRFNDLDSFTREFAEISKEDQIQKLHSLLGPHMLRRMKSDVLTGMPAKSELIVRVELSPMQKKYYRNILTRNFEALSVKSGGTQVSLLNIVMELKKCCNHPYLFAKASLEAPKLPNGAYEGQSLVKASGKFVLLQKMLDILEDLCENEGYRYERIDGSITGQLRQEAIDRFNAPGSKHFVFLLSTRAGGLGINLATADTVIIYDSDWNPHADTQAFSRAHRIGQKNHVMIYRFVTRNSIEERVTTVAKKKMLLTHLVVRAGNAQKNVALSKNELDDMLRWGTEDFWCCCRSSCVVVTANENRIVWDDEAVDALLHRASTTTDSGTEKKDWSDDYLSSFKVAQYVTRQTDEDKEASDEEAEKPEVLKAENEPTDPEYWEKLLRHHYEQDLEVEHQKLGKGKRVRRQVNYASENMHSEWVSQHGNRPEDDEEYRVSFSGSESDETVNGSGADGADGEHSRKRDRHSRPDRSDEKLPALLSRTGAHVEVLGFNPRQRRVFYNAIMRFGMPPPDGYRSQWLVKDLKTKSEKAFKAYSSLFMRHLCEPGADRDDYFNDGVPREGLNRQMVLTRIGIMALIRRKVQEFERDNGSWSMPEVQDEQLTEQLVQLGLMDQNGRQHSRSKEGSVAQEAEGNEEEKKSLEATSPLAESNPLSNKSEAKKDETDEKMEINESNEKIELGESKQSMSPKNEQEKMDQDTLHHSRVLPPFKFNIADGGFTELHTLWKSEEEVIKKLGIDYKIWHRRHDYWLLCGFATHGYGHYQDIMKNPRFALINEPFKSEEDKTENFSEVKQRFLQRRYKMLEQSLIIEEQLRRAANIHYGTEPPANEQNNEESKEKQGTDAAKTEVETNGNTSGLNGKDSAKASSLSRTKKTPESDLSVQRLHKNYAQIESLADVDRAIARDAFAGNRPAEIVLQKVLTQLEEILNDMKSDISRLPLTVKRLPSVCERLNLKERDILKRLTTRDPEAVAGISPLPSPGAFATQVMLTRFNGIQPKFACARSTSGTIQTPTHGAPVVVPIDEKTPASTDGPTSSAPVEENQTVAETTTNQKETTPNVEIKSPAPNEQKEASVE